MITNIMVGKFSMNGNPRTTGTQTYQVGKRGREIDRQGGREKDRQGGIKGGEPG